MNKFKLMPMALIAAVLSLTACSDEGPAEKAGKQIDEMATDTGNAIEDACEDAKENMNAKDTDC